MGLDPKTEASVNSRLFDLSSHIVNDATLESSLDFIFDSFGDLIPYDRIGFAEIDADVTKARARWSRSSGPVFLVQGYSAPLKGSSLSLVISHRKPRVLNDLPAYLSKRPQSHSTKLIVREGIKSSMTCPLVIGNRPTGFLFFSCRDRNVYDDSHVRIMTHVALHLSMLLMAVKPDDANPDEWKWAKGKGTAASLNDEEAKAEADLLERRRRSKYMASHSPPVKLSISQLSPGMVLAEPVHAEKNRMLLLATGITLNNDVIEQLKTLDRKGLLLRETIAIQPSSSSESEPEIC